MCFFFLQGIFKILGPESYNFEFRSGPSHDICTNIKGSCKFIVWIGLIWIQSDDPHSNSKFKLLRSIRIHLNSAAETRPGRRRFTAQTSLPPAAVSKASKTLVTALELEFQIGINGERFRNYHASLFKSQELSFFFSSSSFFSFSFYLDPR